MSRITLLAIGALCLAAVATTRAQPQKQGVLREQLVSRLQTLATGLDGVMGYSILDLESGDRIEHLADEQFPTASTIKLAVLYELFKQADEGKIALDEPKPVDRSKFVGGTGILFELTNPRVSLRDLGILMMVLSDNSATNFVIDAIGIEAVNSRLVSMGLKATQLKRRMADQRAALRGDENVATPRELVLLLESLRRGDGLRPDTQRQLLEILTKRKKSYIGNGLPAQVLSGTKWGELEGVRTDAGVVFLEKRPYIIAVMTTYLKSDAEGERAIEEVSRAAYDYFQRLANGGTYGRQMRGAEW